MCWWADYIDNQRKNLLLLNGLNVYDVATKLQKKCKKKQDRREKIGKVKRERWLRLLKVKGKRWLTPC